MSSFKDDNNFGTVFDNVVFRRNLFTMKKLYIGTLTIALLVVTQSCKTSFRISVKEPAVIDMPEEAKRFGIVNNVTNENSPEKVLGTVLGTQQLNGNVLAAENAVNGLLRAMDHSNILQGEVLTVGDSLHLESGEINWEFVDSLCTARNLQGIAEMVELRTTAPVGGSVLANVSGKTNTKLEGTLVTSFYVAKTHDKFERYSVYDKYNIPVSQNTSVIDILNDVQKKREYYRALGFNLGYDAGKLIYPNWVWVNRQFYNKGSKNLKRAKPMIRQGNWDIAEKQLVGDIEHHKDKVKGRTLYNMALIKEGQGELDDAIDYAERSALAGNKLANDYLRDLKQRKRQVEMLNQQSEN